MLKFIGNRKGIMGLTLNQLGLLIATGIFLSIVFSFIYLNDWGRESDVKNIASGFTTLVEAVDTSYFENTSVFYFPDKGYDYSVSISSEYVSIKAEGSWNSDIFVHRAFGFKPWPRKNVSSADWVSGSDLHFYLLCRFGCSGNISCPICFDNVSDVKVYLSDLKGSDVLDLASSPLVVVRVFPVFIDKVLLYFDSDGDGFFDKNVDERLSFIVLYQ